MRILHILSQRPECTGSGIYLQSIIKHAKQAGYKNFLCAGISGNNLPNIDLIDSNDCIFVRFEGGDLDFPIVGMSDVMPYKSKTFSSLTCQEVESYEICFERKLFKAVQSFKPDIIHSHHLWLMTSLARRVFPDIPIVTTCHGTDLRQFMQCSHLRDKVKKSCKNIDYIMALSQLQKQEIISIFDIPKERVEVVRGGFDDNLFFYEKKKNAPPVEILYAGKLSTPKGVPWLLKSMQLIFDFPWHLHLAGTSSGADQKFCFDLAKHLKDKVTFHGALNHKDLSDLMKKSHIFVLPSFFEGLPLVILEAIASGCHIVTTDLPFSDEILGENKNSDFIEIINLPRLKTIDLPFEKDMPYLERLLADSLLNQINKIINGNPVGLDHINPIIQGFTWSKVFERVDNVYKKALSKNNI